MTIDGYCTLGEDREYDLTESALLQAMDAASVRQAVIVPPDRYLAVFNREGNVNVAQAAQRQRTRLIPACSVNPWYGPAGIEEFRRALGEGARMLVLHPAIQGFSANDELVFPLLEEAGMQQVPVYIHTGQPGSSTPWQIRDLADRYSEISFIMGHCGATDFWNDVVNAAVGADNVFLESSMARPFQFSRYIQALGKQCGILGSWAPLNDLGFEWEQMRRFCPTEAFEAISGQNLARLLGKRGPV